MTMHLDEPSGASSFASSLRAWAVAAILVVVVFAAFYPSLANGFNYDDETNVVRNMRYRGLGAPQLRWMFTTFKAGHYQPLSWMSLGLDYLIWGDRPFGYHLTNLILHAANTVLVFWLAMALMRWSQCPTPEGWGTLAAFVAALHFGVHPLRVESVAWVTERRDVLSSFFLLATVLLYLLAVRCQRRSSRWWWLGSAVFVFALSLLSRAMGVTMPVILLVLDGYPLQRFARESRQGRLTPFLEKIPFLVLAVAAAAVAPLAQKHVGAAALLEHHGVEARISQAFYGLVFYLWKTIVPSGLVAMYELQPPLRFLTVKYGLSALAVVAGVLLVVWVGRRRPAIVAAALCYSILLAPVLGFVQSGQQEVADRYSYLPGIVIAVLIGGALTRLRAAPDVRRDAVQRVSRVMFSVVACGVIAVLCVLTWRQCRVWRTPETLWTHAITHGPPCATAHYNLASLFGQQGRTHEAIQHYVKTLAINRRYPQAFYNLGNAYTQLNKLDLAEQAYIGALRIDDQHVTAWYHLGNALAGQGKSAPAIKAYREAIQLQPEYVEARINLGNQLWKKGARPEAIEAYREAVNVGPLNVDARCNLAGALAQEGQTEEALALLHEAVRIDPSHAEARKRLEVLIAHLAREPSQ